MDFTRSLSAARLSSLLAITLSLAACGPNQSARELNDRPLTAKSSDSIDHAPVFDADATDELAPRLLTPISLAPAADADMRVPSDQGRTKIRYRPVPILPTTADSAHIEQDGEKPDSVRHCAYPPGDQPVRRLPPVADERAAVGARSVEPRLAKREETWSAENPRLMPPAQDPSTDAWPTPPAPGHSGGEIVVPKSLARQVASGALQAVENEAQQRVGQAFGLARRGALFSARAELIGALQMVSQSLDAPDGSSRHSEALAAGLLALREVDDFATGSGQLGSHVDLAHVISGHRTPLLKTAGPESLTPMLAAQSYYTFAQEQLASAAGRLPSASLALYGLGKLQTALPARNSEAETAAVAKAMVFHQAALLAEGRNFLAANEFGVLLARVGQWNEARRVLRHGLTTHSQAELWQNLAKVHQRLGEVQLATLARQEAQRAAQRTHGPGQATGLDDGGGFVRWIPPQAFAQAMGSDAAVPLAPPRR